MRRQCVHWGRDWTKAVTRQEMPRNAGSPQSWKRQRTDSPLKLPWKVLPAGTLILDFWPPERWKNKCLFWSLLMLAIVLRQLQETNAKMTRIVFASLAWSVSLLCSFPLDQELNQKWSCLLFGSLAYLFLILLVSLPCCLLGSPWHSLWQILDTQDIFCWLSTSSSTCLLTFPKARGVRLAQWSNPAIACF